MSAKRKADTDIDPTETTKAKVAPMPRTAHLADDTFITVQQVGATWIPQAASMRQLRKTKSAFVDEAIELETLKLWIPAGTVTTQADFVWLFTECLASPFFQASCARMEACNRVGFHEHVTRCLDNLEEGGSLWSMRPDASTLYHWGRRFCRPKLVRAGLTLLADSDAAIEPHMLGEVVKLLRERTKQLNKIKELVEDFRKSAAETACDEDECSPSCSAGNRCEAHPKLDHDEAEEGDYDLCAVSFLNTILICAKE